MLVQVLAEKIYFLFFIVLAFRQLQSGQQCGCCNGDGDEGGQQTDEHRHVFNELGSDSRKVETVILNLVQEAQAASESGASLGGEARAQFLADGLDGNAERFLNEKN
jgi:hypothetical protein